MIDKTDISILHILQADGRASASEIAKTVELSIPTVIERIKKLTDKGLINKFVGILNHKNAGLDLTAFVFIVSEHSDHYNSFIEQANKCESVMECHSITGSGSHILKVRVELSLIHI